MNIHGSPAWPALLILPLVLVLAPPLTASRAQDLPPISSLPGTQRGPTGPATLEPIPPEQTVPPPAAETLPTRVPEGGPGFVLRTVRFAGDGTLPQAGLEAIVAPFIGEWLTLADVEELRYRLTKHYVDLGYINSGVLIEPDQDVSDGMLALRIVTGRLAEIRVSGQGRLRASYLQGRLQPDAAAPFNRIALQERFQLLLEDPLIDQIQGALAPGATSGSAILDLTVTRARPWELYLRTDNYRPPSTGAERLYLGGVVRNLTGFGDALDLYLGRGYQGQGQEGAIGWSIPLNARDTRLALRYDRSDASLLEEPLKTLDIDSETERFDLSVTHPLWRTLRGQLRLGLLFGWAENRTTLLGEPFSFSAGAIAGESKVTALRFVQEYGRFSESQAFALRSVISHGIDAFDATTHPGNASDSRFTAWLSQAQFVRRLNRQGTQWVMRGGLQLAGESLLPLERFAVGGVNSVRGYRENALVGDSGGAVSVELRHPLWAGKGPGETRHQLQGALFMDAGSAWNHADFAAREDLWSIGVGLLWTMDERLQAELYLGQALTERAPQQDADWQDDGVHVMVQLSL